MSFKIFIFVAVVSLLIAMSHAVAPGWIEMEPDTKGRIGKKLTGMGEVAYEQEADKNVNHGVTFHFIGKNQDVLEKILSEVSDPKSPKYGKYLTKAEIHDLTVDTEGIEKVETYLNQLNEQLQTEGIAPVRITKKTDSSISAEAPVGAWERAFNTPFFHTRHTDSTGKVEQLNRAKEYFLPSGVAPHVRMVTGTVQMPMELRHGPIRLPVAKHHLEPDHV